MSACASHGSERAPDQPAGVLSMSVVSNDYYEVIVIDTGHNAPGDAANLEHEFGDLYQNVGRWHLVKVYKNPVLYYMFSFESLMKNFGVTKRKV
jgi:hypothetical protein